MASAQQMPPPRSNPTPDSNTSKAKERARLRRNQRNSRARKQAYVNDLEKRWGECIRFGAQATAEMQAAARRIFEENKLLRAVLRAQGLNEDDIRLSLDIAKTLQASPGPELEPPRACRPQVPDPADSSAQQEAKLTGLVPFNRDLPEITVEFSGLYTTPDPTSLCAKSLHGITEEMPQAIQEPNLAQTTNLQGWPRKLGIVGDGFNAETMDRHSDLALRMDDQNHFSVPTDNISLLASDYRDQGTILPIVQRQWDAESAPSGTMFDVNDPVYAQEFWDPWENVVP